MARGQQMAQQRAREERMEKIAKLQGQLLEQQLKSAADQKAAQEALFQNMQGAPIVGPPAPGSATTDPQAPLGRTEGKGIVDILAGGSMPDQRLLLRAMGGDVSKMMGLQQKATELQGRQRLNDMFAQAQAASGGAPGTAGAAPGAAGAAANQLGPGMMMIGGTPHHWTVDAKGQPKLSPIKGDIQNFGDFSQFVTDQGVAMGPRIPRPQRRIVDTEDPETGVVRSTVVDLNPLSQGGGVPRLPVRGEGTRPTTTGRRPGLTKKVPRIPMSELHLFQTLDENGNLMQADALTSQDEARQRFVRITSDESKTLNASQRVARTWDTLKGIFVNTLAPLMGSGQVPPDVANAIDSDVNAAINRVNERMSVAPNQNVDGAYIKSLRAELKTTLNKYTQADPTLKFYSEAIPAFLEGIARDVFGAVGVLTNEDITRVATALPKPGDTPAVINSKVQAIEAVLFGQRDAIREKVQRKLNRTQPQAPSEGMSDEDARRRRVIELL